MSGPKVVRIVTREEILEACLGQLARVDAAIAEWLQVGGRNDCVDDEGAAELERRRNALSELLASDRFREFQVQAASEEAFIRSDLRRRLDEAAAKVAASRSRERREKDAASSLLKALRAAGTDLDPDLEEGLKGGEAAAISRGLLMLPARTKESVDEDLARRLKENGPAPSFAAWLEQHANADEQDSAISRIEARIEAISQLGDGACARSWTMKIEEARSAEGARRNLLLDHLEAETGRALTAARKAQSARLDLRMLVAEAEALGLGSEQWNGGLDALGADELAARAERLREAIEAARTDRAVASRRAAVLEGLSALGYSVDEGMETLWASEGRLVLRSATRPDYGVELAGGDRLQMRPVAFEAGSSGPDVSRDRDAETIWCGDVSALRERLSDIGGQLEIERAQPIGAVPLKRIAIAQLKEERSAEAPVRRARSLD